MTNANIVQAQPAPVYFSRWGAHPGDYQTFMQLKELNKAYQKARTQYRCWVRWNRKAVKNRVLRRWVRNEAGQKIGREIVGAWKEPPLNPVFVTREWMEDLWGPGSDWKKDDNNKIITDERGRSLRKGILTERVTFTELPIGDDYTRARRPTDPQSAASIRPLTMSKELITSMLNELAAAQVRDGQGNIRVLAT